MASSSAKIVVEVIGRDAPDLGRKIDAIDVIARTPSLFPPPLGDLPDDSPSQPAPPVVDPVAPFFDIGEATGRVGETVELPVYGGCRFPMSGFHLVAGSGFLPDVARSGYGKFKAIGVKLGSFLRTYLKAEDLIHDEPAHQHDHFWSIFTFQQWATTKPLPEEWWEYAIGFFSLEGQQAAATTIPAGTELLRVMIEILPGVAAGEYEVTCLDEHYSTQERSRRRDLLYVDTRSGGYTKLDLKPGKITVID